MEIDFKKILRKGEIRYIVYMRDREKDREKVKEIERERKRI